MLEREKVSPYHRNHRAFASKSTLFIVSVTACANGKKKLSANFVRCRRTRQVSRLRLWSGIKIRGSNLPTPVKDLRKCGSFVIFYTSEYSVKSSNSDLTGEVYFLLSQKRANTVFLRCEVNNIFPTLSHSLAWLKFLVKIVLPSTVSRSPWTSIAKMPDCKDFRKKRIQNSALRRNLKADDWLDN